MVSLIFGYSVINPIWLFNLVLTVLFAIDFFWLFIFSDQLPVSTKYDMRTDEGVERNYGKLLLEMVSIVPDGIVCFFVSYSYMDGIVNSWNEKGILKVIIYHLSYFLGRLFTENPSLFSFGHIKVLFCNTFHQSNFLII